MSDGGISFLNFGFFGSVRVRGLDILTSALESDDGRGIITVSNHISTLDDPVTWGILPTSYYLSPWDMSQRNKMRWALGASDIMFTNPSVEIYLCGVRHLMGLVLEGRIFSAFFRNGQVLETFRGGGVYQASIDEAIGKLEKGQWVHMYPEGFVNQNPKVLPLRKFKWGIGRILMEAKTIPRIIPMYITGFDQVMPEGRPFPAKYLPNPGADLSVTFGDPGALQTKIVSAVNEWQSRTTEDTSNSTQVTDEMRSHITRVIQDSIELLVDDVQNGQRQRSGNG